MSYCPKNQHKGREISKKALKGIGHRMVCREEKRKSIEVRIFKPGWKGFVRPVREMRIGEAESPFWMGWLQPESRSQCFHSLLRAWNLAAQFYGNPGRPQLAAVEMATAKPCHHTLAASPAKRWKGQATSSTRLWVQLEVNQEKILL